MAATTQRFGFDKFGGALGGSITDNAGKFSSIDRDTLDRILAAFEVHTHVGGVRLADPSGAPTAVVGSGGALPAGSTFYYSVSYVDAYGLETAGSAEVSVDTPAAVQPPASPAATASAGGTLTPGLYYWAGTSTVAGVETPLGPSALLTVASDVGTVTLDFGDLPDGADGIAVWRQGPSDSGFTKIGTTSGTTFIDNGSVAGDPCACDPENLPPTQNLTGATSQVTVTLPVADQAAVSAFPTGSIIRWRLYRSEQSGVYPAAALVHEVVETVDGTAATGLVTTWVDLGNVPLTGGTPLTSSITLTPSVAVSGGSKGVKAVAETADFTLDETSVGKVLEVTSDTPVVITLPAGLAAALSDGSLPVWQVDRMGGAGAVTIHPSGVTINGDTSGLGQVLSAPWSKAVIRRASDGTEKYIITGDHLALEQPVPLNVVATAGPNSANLTWDMPAGFVPATTARWSLRYIIGGTPNVTIVNQSDIAAVGEGLKWSVTDLGLPSGTSVTFSVAYAPTATAALSAYSADSNAVVPTDYVNGAATDHNVITGARTITLPSGNDVYDNSGNDFIAGEPSTSAGDGGTAWYTITAASAVTLNVDTYGSLKRVPGNTIPRHADTKIALYSGPAGATDFTGLTLVAQDDDTTDTPPTPDDAYTSAISQALTSGTTYYLQVGSVNGSADEVVTEMHVNWTVV